MLPTFSIIDPSRRLCHFCNSYHFISDMRLVYVVSNLKRFACKSCDCDA
jgi:hypothetical protein